MMNLNRMPRVEELAVPPLRQAGAGYGSWHLCVVSVIAIDGNLAIDRANSAMFELDSDDAFSLQTLYSECAMFCRRQKVHSIVLRRPMIWKERSAKPIAHKVEATLQLMPDIKVETCHPNTVGAWLRRTGISIPAPFEDLPKPLQDLQQRVIETAAYQVAMWEGLERVP